MSPNIGSQNITLNAKKGSFPKIINNNPPAIIVNITANSGVKAAHVFEGSDRFTRDIEKKLTISQVIRGMVLPFNVSTPLKRCHY